MIRILNMVLALALLAITIEQFAFPDSWWLVIRKFYVPDVITTDPPPVFAIDGSVYKSFDATYDIDIRRVGSDPPDQTHFAYFCSGKGDLTFRAGQEPAPNVDLNWWTKGACPKFSEGYYYAHLIIRWPDFLTRRSISMDSRTWQVSLPLPPPDPIVITKPIIEKRVVTKTVPGPTRFIVRTRCEPSLIPPRSCPPQGHRSIRRGGAR